MLDIGQPFEAKLGQERDTRTRKLPGADRFNTRAQHRETVLRHHDRPPRGCQQEIEALNQTHLREHPQVPNAFRSLLIHGILQFTMLIALRCALRRCPNQDIHR
jgi:hypothetical protein